MSISEHEQQALTSIEDDLARTGPQLASMLAMFVRLTAGEEMPVRERVRRAPVLPGARARGAVAAPSADAGPPHGRPATRRSGPRRILLRLGRHPTWLLLLAFVIVLIAVALIAESTAGTSPCPRTRITACRQAPTPPRSGSVTGIG